MENETTRMVLLLLVGAAIFELGREMRECTPEMSDCRECDHDSYEGHRMRQHMVDGQGHAGIIAIGAALVAWWACKDVMPALIILAVYAALVWYQHSLLSAPCTY